MVFSSINFIFLFLPIFLILYFLMPVTEKNGLLWRNLVLFLGSLVFYAVSGPIYVILMVACIVINFLLARLIEYYDGKEGYKALRKFLFFLCLIINLGILFLFKYAGFVVTNLNHVLAYIMGKTGIELFTISVPQLGMPVGISFYTFQILSYMIDVYKRKYKPETNLITLGTYIAMFPQLVAGPLVQFPEVRNHLKSRKIRPWQMDQGVKDFIIGLSAKVLLANMFGTLWKQLGTIGYESISTPLAWLGAVGYTLQIYFDFWGYSMMAIGLGEIMGFRLPENFKDPYSSRSATEFWQRWHITLGSWFREYVYIPLGGNRVGKAKLIRNIFVVWFLTGLWHGANWNFIIWGLGYFVILMVEKLFLKKWLEKTTIISRIYTLLIVTVSWVVFAIEDFHSLCIYLHRMFPFVSMEYTSNVNALDYLKYGKHYGIFFLIGIILCVPAVRQLLMKIRKYPVADIVFLVLFFYSIYQLSQGLDNPFLYFRF